MQPLFFTISNDIHLKVIPDIKVIQDGHPIICHTYNLFVDRAKDDAISVLGNEAILPANKYKDPDYLGNIMFDKPDHIFTYEAGNENGLSSLEIEEVIMYLSHIRNNPELWKLNGDLLS